MIGDRDTLPPQARSQSGNPVGQAGHMVGVHDVGIRERFDEVGRERVCGVIRKVHTGAQHADRKPDGSRT
jgi:hypothetical protein